MCARKRCGCGEYKCIAASHLAIHSDESAQWGVAVLCEEGAKGMEYTYLLVVILGH